MKSILISLLATSYLLWPQLARSSSAKSADIVSDIRTVAYEIDQAKFTDIYGRHFDYGLDKEAGIKNTYEYLYSLVTFSDFQEHLPIKIFLSGPHTSKALILNDRSDFGHYNPKFVTFFHASINSLIKDKTFIKETRGKVINYGLIRQLTHLNTIYSYISSHKNEFKKFRAFYQIKVSKGEWTEDGYRKYIPKSLDDDQYWSWSETAYYFWIRRDIDGTKQLWFDVITDILHAYS